MPLEHYLLADTPGELERGLAAIADLDTVAVDVERADWDRYWRAAALIQVGGGGRVTIVDPLALEDLTPLEGFLVDRTVVFHAMENDLGPLATLGISPSEVQDTAIAAALLGLPTGLETLLAELLGVTLGGDKQAMQRANWEARPLSEEMLVYAAGDVADLPALWAELERRLREAGRHDWYGQEVDALRERPPSEQRRNWTRTKGAGRLDPMARSRLRALWDAREEIARSTDTAPGRLISDRQLVDLATKPPANVRELHKYGIRRQVVRNVGNEVVTAIAAAEAAGPDAQRIAGPVPTEADRAVADRLRALRAEQAQRLGIDAGVLCPSRTLLSAVLSKPRSAEELRAALGLRAWQWDQLAEPFCEALNLESAGTRGTHGPTQEIGNG